MPRILGEHPLAKDANGKLKSRIATVSPLANTIVTLPGIHATQRMAYVDVLAQQRLALGLGPLSREEEAAEWQNSVDLIVEDDTILIRPDPDNMPLSFRADELLQELVPKHRVKFLLVRNERVRTAIKQRGECWRISPLPKTPDEMKRMIAASRIAIRGNELYYYSKATGTRFLTCESFSQLGGLGDSAPAAASGRNPRVFRRREPPRQPGNRLLHGRRRVLQGRFRAATTSTPSRPSRCRAVYETLRQKFCDAVPPSSARTTSTNLDWRNRDVRGPDRRGRKDGLRRIAAGAQLRVLHADRMAARRKDRGGGADFRFRLRSGRGDRRPELRRLCDEKCRGFIFNFVREYGDLEYVNIGRVVESLSQRGKRPAAATSTSPKSSSTASREEIVKIIRMQKWGIREHLDDGKNLLDAIIHSEEYTEYILDRRLGCRQLGMNLPARTTAKRISERYFGLAPRRAGATIWSPYFERDYIRGMATDKIPPHKLADAAFASRLGPAAGPGRRPQHDRGTLRPAGPLVFDDGDEVVIENEPVCRSKSSWPTKPAPSPTTAPIWSISPRNMPARSNRRIPLLERPRGVRRRVRRCLRHPLLQDSTGVPEAEAGVRHPLQAPAAGRGGQFRLSLGMRAGPLAAGRAAEPGQSDPQPYHHHLAAR